MFESLKTDYTIFTDCPESDHLCEYFNVNDIVFDFVPSNQDGIPLIDQIYSKANPKKKILLIVSSTGLKQLCEQKSNYHNFFNLVKNNKIKIIFYQKTDSIYVISKILNFLKDLNFDWWSDALVSKSTIQQFKNCRVYYLNCSAFIDIFKYHHFFNLYEEKEKINTFFTLTRLHQGKERLHRTKLVEEIQNKSYLKNAITSITFPNANKDKLFLDLKNNYGSIFLKNSLWFDGVPVISYYEKTYFELVTESLGAIDGDDSFHITEKTLKPIMMRHPFIMLSTKHYLKNLRGLGFKTFGDFIDESYDDCDTVQERVDIISKNLERLDMTNSKKFYEDSKEICQHNQNHLMYLVGRYKFDLWNKWNNFFKNFN